MNLTLFQWTFSSQNIQGRFLQLHWKAAQQLYHFYSELTHLIFLVVVPSIMFIIVVTSLNPLHVLLHISLQGYGVSYITMHLADGF
jgi:hypothetical protein